MSILHPRLHWEASSIHAHDGADTDRDFVIPQIQESNA
jgi:hypothetical protein